MARYSRYPMSRTQAAFSMATIRSTLMRRIPKLLAFRADARETPPPLADLDPFSCNLRLQALSSAPTPNSQTIFRLVPDQVHIVALPPDACVGES